MEQNHTNHEERLEALKKKIEKGKMQKIQAETRISSLQEQYKKTAEDLKALGIDPKKAKETILEMEKEIERELSEIESLLPEFIQ